MHPIHVRIRTLYDTKHRQLDHMQCINYTYICTSIFIPRFVTALLYISICIQPKHQTMVIIRTYLWLTLVSVNIHYTGYIYKVVENPMQYAQLIQHIIGTLECSKTNIHAHNHVNEYKIHSKNKNIKTMMFRIMFLLNEKSTGSCTVRTYAGHTRPCHIKWLNTFYSAKDTESVPAEQIVPEQTLHYSWGCTQSR